MPIVIAAIVIVIMSKGIPSKPIIPRMKKAAKKLAAKIFKKDLGNLKNVRI